MKKLKFWENKFFCGFGRLVWYVGQMDVKSVVVMLYSGLINIGKAYLKLKE